jgi:diaminopimelate epimerase
VDGLAPPLGGDDGQAIVGRAFYKMTGSGNDFVVFDSSAGPFGELESPATVVNLCARGTGIGADGAVFLEPAGKNVVRMRYYNADGSRATLCGNASLCSTRLSLELGLASGEFTLETDAGPIHARIRDGLPEIDLQPVEGLDPETPKLAREPGEARIGFALVGVPQVVVEVRDLEGVDFSRRGNELRWHPSLAHGANVNFVAEADGTWAYRTFERGVEGETLACGSGAVATAVLLSKWGQAGTELSLKTRSGKPLVVRHREADGRIHPSLRGEGRIVFEGRIRDLV